MGKCEICGELMWAIQEPAEMYDPNDPSKPPVICHPQCGLEKGYEVA